MELCKFSGQKLLGVVLLISGLGLFFGLRQLQRDFRAVSAPVVMLATSERPREYNTGNMRPKPTVPMSLVMTCQEEDFWALPIVMESLANQTVFPHETVFVMNLSPVSAEGFPLAELNFDSASLSQRYQEKKNANQEENVTKSIPVARWHVLNRVMNLEDSLLEIPNLKIQLRAGKHFAGNNRMFGAKMARNDSKLISFWDCDDYLHHQRTEYLWKIFEVQPELEAVVHALYVLQLTKWNLQIHGFREAISFNPSFSHSYEQIHNALPVEQFSNKEPLVRGNEWWFPRFMGLKYPTKLLTHNGCVTIKPEVLQKVEYPDHLSRGQDSAFVWRLIKNRVNFNFLELKLAGYVRGE